MASDDIEIVKLTSGKELHRFINPEIKRPYLIEWETDELTSLCPQTGHPDFCHLVVRSVPGEWCGELKSIKLYIESFRNEGHFYERLINRIFDDFQEALSPRSMEMSGSFNIRGGIP
ncbi:MAG: NADPH-dependent 7-cyano-7-deazaguanine reductase QueF, partial [Thaumarchaeota archaeon]|nr:NADPH-dependent 7-cyano-7-deazaguanine reductase QueF [Nitrososphaerota archaeon]